MSTIRNVNTPVKFAPGSRFPIQARHYSLCAITQMLPFFVTCRSMSVREDKWLCFPVCMNIKFCTYVKDSTPLLYAKFQSGASLSLTHNLSFMFMYRGYHNHLSLRTGIWSNFTDWYNVCNNRSIIDLVGCLITNVPLWVFAYVTFSDKTRRKSHDAFLRYTLWT